MDELKNLAKIIESRGADEIQLLDPKNRNSKEWKLFEGVLSGVATTDAEAIKLLYKENESTAGFKMLKSRLRKKLMNHLFFLDLSSSSFPTNRAKELDCHSKLYQAHALINSGLNDLAYEVLKQLIPVASTYEFNKILDSCYEALVDVFAFLNDKSNLYKIKKKWDELQPILVAERDSTLEFRMARVEINQSVTSRKAYLSKIDDKLERLESIWRRHQTYVTFENYFQFSIWSYELKGEYEKIIELTHLTEVLVKENKINAHRFDVRYNRYMQVYAHLRTHRYEEGLRLASLYESFFNVSSSNWFAFMGHYFLLALHSKKYEIAHLVLQRVLGNTFITKITKLAQERWALFEAYLQIVSPSLHRSFQLQAIVQNLPTYSKDKEGYNVAILILQVMYYLQKYDVEALAYRTEALKKYAQKHFKDEFSERSRLFFKLLDIMVQSNFDPVISEKKGKSTFQKLSHTPAPSEGYAEIEIVPYEHLWELILQRLYQLASVK